MGSVSGHLRKANHNENFLKMIQMNDPGPSFLYPDWLITIAFYIALHYVDAKLARRTPPLHPQNHKIRNTYVSLFLPPDIAQDYLYLYNKAMFARYFPDSEKRISPATVQRCINLALTRFPSI